MSAMDSAAHVGACDITFPTAVEPTRLSIAYRLGLVVTAVAMLLLPILYIALIGAAAIGVWWHLTENTWILGGGARQWRLLLYLTPAVSGAALVFFMVKPILARPSRRQEPVTLQPDDEPQLFALIDDICKQVGAPRPQRVDVNCTVNASASFMSGPLNLFRNDLVLTIGLPLAGGLSARELAGVLAHEFGHFAQGGGMRLTGIVRGVNFWFARVVHERDEWDEKLERWSREADWRIRAVLGVARIAVWLSRRVLSVLMAAGHAISCFMMRQMEYDADSYEIKLAGSEAFAHTAMRLRELNMAAQFAYHDLRTGLQGGAVPADLPTLMVERSSRLPAELLEQVRLDDQEKTKIFDTHPCDADRIRAAKAAAAPGVIVNADVPATCLFSDFGALSAQTTRHHFEHDLGLNLDGLTIVDTHSAIRQTDARRENVAAIDTLLGDRFSAYRPIYLPVEELKMLSPYELVAHWSEARDEMTAAGSVTDRYRQYEELEGRRQKAFAAQELLMSGFSKVKAEDFELRDGTSAAAVAAEEAAAAEQTAVAPALGSFEAAVGRRLACAVLLRERSEAGADDIAATVKALNTLATVTPLLLELRRMEVGAEVLRMNASSDQPEHLVTRYSTLDAGINGRLGKLEAALQGCPCPAAFAASSMTLAARCGLPAHGLDGASEVTERAFQLYVSMFGSVVATAMQTESTLVAQ